MFRWYRELTSREQKTFWACFGGFGLDGMDVQIYSFVIPMLFLQVMPRDCAWRALFFVGILPALFIFFIRRSVPEPDIYREQGRAEQRGAPLAIFGRAVIRRTALGALLAVGAQGGYYAITTWLPTFLQKERGLTILSSGGYLAVIIVGSFVGYLVSAYLSDLIGGWFSPVARAGGDVSKEGFPKVTPTQTAQHSDSGSSMGQTNYGAMVVAGIIAVLTAIVGASIWRSHELAGKGI